MCGSKPTDALRTLPERAFRLRARLIAVGLCAVCFAGLIGRLFWLQLCTGGWYTQRALGQQLRDTVVPAVVCKPEESPVWFDKLWQNTVDLFRTLDIPVRTLECCSGDLADLKVKSIDVEAWSPRQKKYFEVGSCSNLGDAQARRLQIRVRKEDGSKYFAHTLNNTVVAPPRMLIAFLENNLQEDGSVRIPEALRPYMGGKEALEVKKK